jgi:ribosome hibernation promoting factor
MQLKLTGHHIEITPALRRYVASKLRRIVRHFDHHVVDAHTILTVEKLRHKAEATILVSGAQLHADAVEEDMYAAIDVLVDKLDRQVKKHKEKLTDHHARDANKSRLA